MDEKDKRSNNSIHTELTNDLHFLALEVKHLLALVKETISTMHFSKLEKVKKRIDYIENLESRIKTLSYDAIFKLKTKDKAFILNYRVLIRITECLAKIGDFLVQAANQVIYIQDLEAFKKHDLSAFYDCIEQQLDRIHQAFSEVDKKKANQICESEIILDQLYLQQFNYIQDNISKKAKSSDMLTLLFIVRYFERIGDSFLNIGESILNISIGDTLNIKHYRKLEKVVKDLSNKKEMVSYDFKPFLFSRSGCKVGRLLLIRHSRNHIKSEKLFYKQGDTVKIVEEIEGLKLWNKNVPGTTPEIRWKSVEKENSTLVVNYIKGENLLNIILGEAKNGKVKKVSFALQKKLNQIWTANSKKSSSKSKMVKQIVNRKEAITNVHEDFFEEFTIGAEKKTISFQKMLNEAKEIEKNVSIPFKVLCHGDFNLDNVIYNEDKDNIYFVDVHRSAYHDYAQEISIFIVSSLRIKLEDSFVRKKINTICTELFEFAKDFAARNGDTYFEARLAFGLFRSFVTSTRFVSDDEWYHKMRMNALVVFDKIEASKKSLKTLKIDLDEILE